MAEDRSHQPAVGRRGFTFGVTTSLLGALAGCTGDEPWRSSSPTSNSEGSRDPDDVTTTSDPAGTETTASGADDDEASDSTATPDLDLREANVVDVAFEPRDGSYRFSVTLYHDDDGEDGYADWWQVETTTGDRLGRRELLHAHGTQPFTRSETIEIPSGVACVVVRGHDQTHGYGGRAMVVNLDARATRMIDQGSDRRAVGSSECP